MAFGHGSFNGARRVLACTGVLLVGAALLDLNGLASALTPAAKTPPRTSQNAGAVQNSQRLYAEGQHTFRFDTFGDQAFWGGALQLHKAIAGAGLGGVGPGVSPKTALAVGLKVDVNALPRSVKTA